MNRWTRGITMVSSLTLLTGMSAGLVHAAGLHPAKSGPTVSITFATFFSQREPVLVREIKTFEKLHPNIRVTVEREPGSEAMLQKLLTELLSGTAPNVVSQFGPWTAQLAKTPGIVPLDSFIKRSHYAIKKQFYPDNLATITVDGKVVAMPVDNDNLMVFYNKALFTKYHVPFPKSNWTWQQMLQDAKRLNHPTAHDYGYLMPVGTTEGVTWRWEPFLWQLGGHLTNRQHTKATFNSPAGVKAMTFFQHLAAYSDLAARSEHENPFTAGRVAMTITGSWNPVTFTQDKINYGVVPLPAPYPGGPHTTNAGPDVMVMTKSTPAKEEASWQLMMYLDNRDNAAQQAALGHLPFRPDALTTPVYQRLMKKYPVFKAFAANAAKWARIRPAFPQYSEVSSDIGHAIEEVILKKMTPRQALDQAAQQANQQLHQAAP